MTRRRRFSLLMLACCSGPAACRDDGGGDGSETSTAGPGSSSDDSGPSADTSADESGDPSTTPGDGSSSETTGAAADPTPVDLARAELPSYLDLHDKVISRTCTPNEGVCHNDKEYPDLHTPQAMLGAIAQPCNLVLREPIETFDGCEVAGDTVSFFYGANTGFSTEIAWTYPVDATMMVVGLRDTIPLEADGFGDGLSISRDYVDGTFPLVDLYDVVSYAPGEAVLVIAALDQLGPAYTDVLDSLYGGDPNQNGVFGAELPGFSMVTPGDPASSYLLGRLQATVPGTPMPLANQPLDSAEMIAMTCWIEGLAAEGANDVYAAIDYDNCAAAAAFGVPDPQSGHSLANDVQPIFDQYCTAAGCHGGAMPSLGLSLEAGLAREQLLRLAVEDPQTPLLEPGNPTNSYLMIKLWSNGNAGLRMPRSQSGEGEALPEQDVATIERWIVAGAPDD